MLKWFSLLAIALGLQTAHANDSGIALIDILGVAAGTSISKSEVMVYGGDTKSLYDVLPVTSVGNWKTLYLLSGQYAVYIWCSEEYDRPTNGEKRNDYSCTMGMKTRAAANSDLEEVDHPYVEDHQLHSFHGSNVTHVLGISAKTTGRLFSFYGENAGILARKLPKRLKFQSANFTVRLSCDKQYRRPTTGELRDDYMCSVYVE